MEVSRDVCVGRSPFSGLTTWSAFVVYNPPSVIVRRCLSLPVILEQNEGDKR